MPDAMPSCVMGSLVVRQRRAQAAAAWSAAGQMSPVQGEPGESTPQHLCWRPAWRQAGTGVLPGPVAPAGTPSAGAGALSEIKQVRSRLLSSPASRLPDHQPGGAVMPA